MHLHFTVILMVILSFIAQVYAPPPPSSPVDTIVKSTTPSSLLSSFHSSKSRTAANQLTISIFYEAVGTQKLPKVDTTVKKLVNAAARRLGIQGKQLTFEFLNTAASATGEVRFSFWGPEACQTAKEDAESHEHQTKTVNDDAESDEHQTKTGNEDVESDEHQTKALQPKATVRRRNCEAIIEDMSKGSNKNVLMYNAKHDVVYANWK
ncbi:hypothetical protein F5890DRAFT_435078 [Lentinula detonsa]|uniref:Uncharacterized protein n=1 Tax=Lentinula detonsa TaxID=2804962 RepID=A0AA38PVI8_9AGAR|nr:hypothetical protein F5890DRAFT_435078 [Lentinula detonsa]